MQEYLKKHRGLGYALSLASLVVWFLLIVVTPYLYSIGQADAGEFLFKLFKPTCHQLPERSFFLFGYQMPVCARDTGIYFSMLLAALIYPAVKKIDETNLPNKWYLVASIIPIAIDGGTQFLAALFNNPSLYWLSFMGLSESTNELRIVTGFIVGFVSMFYAIPLANITCSLLMEFFSQLRAEFGKKKKPTA